MVIVVEDVVHLPHNAGHAVAYASLTSALTCVQSAASSHSAGSGFPSQSWVVVVVAVVTVVVVVVHASHILGQLYLTAIPKIGSSQSSNAKFKHDWASGIPLTHE